MPLATTEHRGGIADLEEETSLLYHSILILILVDILDGYSPITFLVYRDVPGLW